MNLALKVEVTVTSEGLLAAHEAHMKEVAEQVRTLLNTGNLNDLRPAMTLLHEALQENIGFFWYDSDSDDDDAYFIPSAEQKRCEAYLRDLSRR